MAPVRRLALALVCSAWTAYGLSAAEGPDDDYVRLFNQLQRADRLAESGQAAAARSRYQEVQAALRDLGQRRPDWNPQVIQFRLRYVAEKLAALPSGETTGPRAGATNAAPAPSLAATNRAGPVVDPMALLNARIRQLESDNTVLEARLREALAARPAAVDPLELAKAEATIKSQQKEIEVLKVNLAKAQARAAVPASASALEDAQSALAQTRQELAAEVRRGDTLTLEKEALQRQLQETQARYEALAAEKRILEKRLADLAGPPPELPAQWVPIGVPESAELPGRATAAPVDRILQLEQERDLWQRRFEATSREILHAKLRELDDAVPPSTGVAVGAPANSAEPSAGPLRPVTGPVTIPAPALAVAPRRQNEADSQSTHLGQRDERDLLSLTRLAAVQLEENRPAEAEATLRQARTLAPTNTLVQYLTGRLRFQQGRVDEALAALSQAAQGDPRHAETFHYLGRTLAAKGLPDAAESALRRTVQLAPDCAPAHLELALLYLRQRPPSEALAQWHYGKALACGHARDPGLERLLGSSGTAPARP